MMHFTKLHGNGNDFILVDEYEGEIVPEKSTFARKFCDRHFGIGADGVLYLSRSEKADVKMRIFNPDGTEAEMCGNGIRCLVKYALDEGYINEKASVETQAGVLSISSHTENKTWVTVDMGRIAFERENIPAKGSGEFLNVKMHGYNVSAVNTGVPHAVIFVDSFDFNPMLVAPKIRHDAVFPSGANVNFAVVNSGSEITIRTYERGVEAETLSCGTGAVACAAVARRLGKTGDKVRVNTRGGELRITLTDSEAFMEGSAERVYEGGLNLNSITT